MATPRGSQYTVYTAMQYSGHTATINSQTITPYVADQNGDLLLCTGTVLVTDGGTGFAKGCQYIKTDVATGTGGMYLNKGTNTSCQFTLVTQA
jgi:hypothetical protein